MKGRNNINISEIEDINHFSHKNIDSLFGEYANIDYIKEKILQQFDAIYLIDVAPNEISKYKDYKDVYNLLQNYIRNNAAENRNLQLMFFKINDVTLKFIEEQFEKYKKEFGDLVVKSVAKYYVIIGYYGGSLGRKAQGIISEIKKHFDVININ